MNVKSINTQGGKRVGSGRKVGTGKFRETTSVLRIPNSQKHIIVAQLEALKTKTESHDINPVFKLPRAVQNAPDLAIPIYSGRVSAGQSRFPSPAQDYEQEDLDLNKHLVKNIPATFFYRVGSNYDSMIDIGILPEALLIVDRSITPKSSHIVLAHVEGEIMVKRLYKWKGVVELRSENKERKYPPITFKEGQELIVAGVVTFNVNALK